MRNKLLATFVLALIALASIGYSYTSLTGWIYSDDVSNCSMKFIFVTTSDNEHGNNIANVSACIAFDGWTIFTCISNAYPDYEAYVNYTIQNAGNRPIHIENITAVNPNSKSLKITTTNLTCTWLQPSETVKGSATILILQQAREKWLYIFIIRITASSPSEHPRSKGFWKEQFAVALGAKKGEQQVLPTTLEQYLTQVSSQSGIFKFTGTRAQKFQQALSILGIPDNSNMEAKLKAQLLALWLNYVAGWTEHYAYKGMTAMQIIQGSENALFKHQTNKYEYWKNLCEGFNTIE
jgi:hypothetical protein